MTTLAPTDADLEENRRALLSEIVEEATAEPWTPEASEVVDIIDNGDSE